MSFHRNARIAVDQRTYFNSMVDVFDVPQDAGVMRRLSQIVLSAAIKAGDSVVDVGTGTGVLIPLIEACGPSRIIACDLAENMLRRVHSRYPRVHCIQCDAGSLPLGNAAANVIFMNAMYGNIADKPGACRSAARILCPGGRFLVSHPEGSAFIASLRESTGLFIEPFPAREEFAALVNPLGLRIEEYRDEPKLYLAIAVKPA